MALYATLGYNLRVWQLTDQSEGKDMPAQSQPTETDVPNGLNV